MTNIGKTPSRSALVNIARRLKARTPQYNSLGPVHFQPLEWELGPTRPYLKGRVLNAGCGNRDIGIELQDFDIAEVVNYDIASDLEGAIIGSLDRLPFGSAEFDAVLCNAVLEHVNSDHDIIQELVRVLRPGGYIVVAIPFLQPFHPCPNDFRRFTKDGIRTLGAEHGLEVVAIYPAHTIAQTLGWIIWTYLEEKESRFWKAAFYPVIWCWTRYCCRTDFSLDMVANTFQGIYRKPL